MRLIRNVTTGFFLVIISSCITAKHSLSGYKASYKEIDTTIKKDGRLEALLLPYRLSMDSAMNIIIGSSAVPLSKAQPECTVGNFMADAQLYAARAFEPATAVSVMNYGGIRLPYIGPGPLSKGKIYELMPFDNKLTIVAVPGKIMRQFCDHIAAWGGWPVSGISFEIKDKKAINIRVGGEPLTDQVIYQTVMSDYIANGGDQCVFLTECEKRYTNIFIRDVLIGYITDLNNKGQAIHPKLEKRISYAE
jgi:2',3'-cyclic-nucleotide 2'-phosphodiesterase (5'-nucleotidase family)